MRDRSCSASAPRRVLLFATLAVLFSSLSVAAADKRRFDIAAGQASSTLNEFSRQSELQIYFDADAVRRFMTNAVAGEFEAADALSEMLAGTDLVFEFINERTLAVMRSSARKRSGTARDAVPESLSVSGAFVRAATQDEATTGAENESPRERTEQGERRARDLLGKEHEKDYEEIVITGSQIRGVAPVGSPLLVIDREEIDRSGFSTAQDVIQSLPQNFRGDGTEDNNRNVAGAINPSRAASVNLRGLGESSTLVLLNGRRLAPAGGFAASFVDISNLPLTAVERVEVLTDGASAIYGADAIAGVVNFILRDDYHGVQTRLRYGAVTTGGQDEKQVNQLFGRSWEGGSFLLSYEFLDKGNLDSSARAFAANSDLRPLGGSQFGFITNNPANIAAPRAAAIPPGQDGTSLEPGDLLLGITNLSNTRQGVDLLADQERHSVFLTAKQSVASSVDVFGETRFSRRTYRNRIGGQPVSFITVPNTHPLFVTPTPGASTISVHYDFFDDFGPQVNTGDVTSYGATIGTTVGLGERWQAELYGGYVAEEADNSTNSVNTPNLREALGFDNPATSFSPAVDGYFNVFGDGSNTAQNVLDYVRNGFARSSVDAEMWSANFKADGRLFEVPGGAVRLALGLEYRKESLSRQSSSLEGTTEVFSSTAGVDLSRDVYAAFSEVLIPFVGNDNQLPGLRELAVSVAGRFEDYSDFGTTTNPKFGLLWSPAAGLSLRGSYGTSFKAPTFHQLAPNLQIYSASSLADLTPADGRTLSLVLQGNNPMLGPEEATSWTAGVDFQPLAVPSLHVEVTHFDVEFQDRIGTIGSAFSALLQPDLFGPVVTLNPDIATVQAILDSPFFNAFAGRPAASDVRAIVDGRLQNLAVTNVTGLDLIIEYVLNSRLGTFNFKFNGDYLLDFERAVTSAAPILDVASTINNPVDLRLRSSASWADDGLGATLFVNYIKDYKDNVSVPNRKIGSWTTLDLNLSWSTDERTQFESLRDLQVSLSIQNLFDRDPPFANNAAGIGYDRQNASALGRVVAFQVSKEW